MKFFDSEHLLVATNENHWSWEYDSVVIKANLIFNIKDSNLFLDLVKTHYKSGLGAGETRKHIGRFNVGTLKKPKKGEINSILSKNKLDKPFPRDGWYAELPEKQDGKRVFYQMKLAYALQQFMKSEDISRMLKLNKIKKLLNN